MENSHKDYNTNPDGTQSPFRIDPEFADKLPALSEDEFNLLRENILADGRVERPLTVWNGVLVDGHNRWKIIQEYPDLPWSIEHRDFENKWAAFDWMFKNQLGQRNLTDEQRTYAVGKMYEARKKSFGGNRGTSRDSMGQFTASAQSEHLPNLRTADTIADELHIGKETVKRSEKFAKGVDAIREVSPEAADKVLSGKTGATKAEVADIAKQEPSIIEAFAQAINEGKKPTRQKRPPKTEEEKRDLAEIEAIVADMRDPTTTPVFTIDYLIEDIELNGKAYVELLANTMTDRQALMTDENKPRIVAAINKVVENILKVRDSI